MFRVLCLVSQLAGCALLVAACDEGGMAAARRSPAQLNRCLQMFGLWMRYETEHCPNTTGQRAQAEWAVYRCQQGDFERVQAPCSLLAATQV